MKVKVISRLYMVILIACSLIILLGFFRAKAQIYDHMAEESVRDLAVAGTEQISPDVKRFLLEPELDDKKASLSLVFFSNHQYVEVYADEDLIYSMHNTDSFWGRTTGSTWNFVEIPTNTKLITVDMTAVYTDNRNPEVDFYIGNAVSIYDNILRRSLLEMVAAFLIIVSGLVLLVYWIVVSRHTEVGKDMLYLGIFAILLGVWSFNETDGAALLINNRVAASYLAFMSLMLMGVPFALFVQNYFRMKGKFFSTLLSVLSIINIVQALVLLALGRGDLKENLNITHSILVLALLYLFGCMAFQWFKHRINHKWKINLIGVALLLISTITDLYAYYANVRIVDVFGKYGFLTYIILLGYETSTDSLKKIQEGRKAAIYRELAVSDMLTGMYNRNAFDDFIKKQTSRDGSIIFIFDLNNLKQCNDHQGHLAGDKYIVDAAALIKRVFSVCGTCFRIGGDEFCVYIGPEAGADPKDLINRLKELEESYNKAEQKAQKKRLAEGKEAEPEIVMQIAYGYAIFDSTMDHDFETVRSRADEVMYQNKEKIKNAGV